MVRSDYAIGNLRKDVGISDTTITALQLPLSATGSTVGDHSVTVRDSTFFPNVDLNSYNYSLYDITSMIFEFIPQLGTAYTGNVSMAFSKDMTKLDQQETYDSIALFPTSVETPVHQGCKLLVTADKMNHGPEAKGLIIDPQDGVAGTLQNYYSGKLWLGTRNVSLNGTLVGTTTVLGRIQLTYVLSLKQPCAPSYPTAWVRAPSIEDDDPVITLGMGGNFRFISADSGDVNYRMYSMRGGWLMVVHAHDGVHGFGLKIDTVATSPGLTLLNATHTVSWYPITGGHHALQFLPGADFNDFEMTVSSRCPLS